MSAVSLALISFGLAAMLFGFGLMISAAKASRNEWEEHEHDVEENRSETEAGPR